MNPPNRQNPTIVRDHDRYSMLTPPVASAK